MRLRHLSLRLFRNLNFLEFSPNRTLNFIFGDNAQGKTSLLEGIYFLSTLRSFRTSKTQELIQFGSEGFQVEGEFEDRDPASSFKIKARVRPHQRELLVNDRPVTKSKIERSLRTVVFSPDSLASIKYGPELRRELVDQAVFQISPRASSSYSQFVKTLKQRNACLKQIKSGAISLAYGRAFLESLEFEYLRCASEVIENRLKFIDAILPSMQESLSRIVGESVETAVICTSHDRAWAERDFEAVFSRIKAELKADGKQAAEEAMGVTLTGPHRHDLTFLFNRNDSRNFCSQGQQRALILAFKIAEIVYHRTVFDSFPLLLLDDVLSEFDEGKRRLLVEFLLTSEAQTFLTTTDQDQILKQGSIFQIVGGQIKQMKEDVTFTLRGYGN